MRYITVHDSYNFYLASCIHIQKSYQNCSIPQKICDTEMMSFLFTNYTKLYCTQTEVNFLFGNLINIANIIQERIHCQSR
jgi:hypothetical protein